MNSNVFQLMEQIKNEKINCSLMEVCGTHTMAIAKSGIRGILPDNIRLLTGPGCPVCFTSQADIDPFIEEKGGYQEYIKRGIDFKSPSDQKASDPAPAILYEVRKEQT